MKITAEAERFIDAPAARLYSYIADFRRHHPNFLPPQFSDFQVESGGVGAGTVHRFRMTLGGRSETYRVRVGEPRPGRVLIESDPSRSMLTTFTVEPQPGGGTLVGITTSWYTPGIRGVVERIAAPRLLRKVYRDELRLLAEYARSEPAAMTSPADPPRVMSASSAR